MGRSRRRRRSSPLAPKDLVRLRDSGIADALVTPMTKRGRHQMQKHLKATVAFSGEMDHDPAGAAADPARAAAALREAGYEVVMMPEKFRSRVGHPGDDFIEVTKRIVGDDVYQAIDAMMDDVNTIVERYGGNCDNGGQIDEDYVPFSDLDLGEAGGEVEQGEQERSDE